MAEPIRLALVRQFWAAYQARDWVEARQLMHPDAHCTWWTSRERFVGADAVVHVNAVYPEGWTIHVLAVEALSDDRALSLVRVDQDGASHYGHAWFSFVSAAEAAIDEVVGTTGAASVGAATGVGTRHEPPLKIAAIEEFWAADEAPPAWREGLPGRERLGSVCDRAPLGAAVSAAVSAALSATVSAGVD